MAAFSERKKRVLIPVLMTVIVVVAVLCYLTQRFRDHSNVLWGFVSQQCVPDMQENHRPAPCEKVDLSAGYVLFKDRNGPLQYLLMPVSRITGIESPVLLAPGAANYMRLAWQERHLLSEKYRAPIKDTDLAVSINSEYGRTQNQLHIHISCLRPDIARQLTQLKITPDGQWQAYTLLSHPYLIRILSPAELEQQSVFARVAQEIPGATENMGDYGLAMTALPDGKLVLMAVKRQWLKGITGSAEELQDHRCAILGQKS